MVQGFRRTGGLPMNTDKQRIKKLKKDYEEMKSINMELLKIIDDLKGKYKMLEIASMGSLNIAKATLNNEKLQDEILH